VLVKRVYRTTHSAPDFSRGAPPWWGVQGCIRCVLFKSSHIVSNIMFFAAGQCDNFSQVLKPFLSRSMNCLHFVACLFVRLVRWPSLDHESFFLSSVQPPFFRTDCLENVRCRSLEYRTLRSFIAAHIRSCMFWWWIAMHCSLWNTRSCSSAQPGPGNRAIAFPAKFSKALWKHQKPF